MTKAIPMQIDIVSDVVCPWCIIGYKNLEDAISRLDGEIDVTLRWHPFELNRDMPPEGQDLSEHISEKYGLTADQSADNRARITMMGKMSASRSISGQMHVSITPLTRIACYTGRARKANTASRQRLSSTCLPPTSRAVTTPPTMVF